MPKIFRKTKKKSSLRERGQVLVIVAVAAIAIIAIIGLVMDLGLMFIGNARLRRAVDGAALSAALQYRKVTNPVELQTDLTNAANEFLLLNGFPNPNSVVSTCDFNTTADMDCSTTQVRKLVRVYATVNINLAFLPIIGIQSVPISAVAISETASLDMVLVIDRSESMTYDANSSVTNNGILYYTDPMRDPSYCNNIPGAHGEAGSCEPFDKVVDAAIDFADNDAFYPYDQISVVTFDKEPTTVLTLAQGNNQAAVDLALKSLKVYEGDETGPGSNPGVYPNGSPSRCYSSQGHENNVPRCADSPTTNPSNYVGLQCPQQDATLGSPTYTGDPSTCTTTNIGGGLRLAAQMLPTDQRQQVLWVVILLTDGVANAGHTDNADRFYCPGPTDPVNTWWLVPRCDKGYPVNLLSRLVPTNLSYDELDYAYDQADYVGLPYDPSTNPPSGGQDALLYTIGLGSELNNYPQASYVDPYNTDFTDYPNSKGEGLGRIFLNYAAHVGNGQAFYSTNGSDLKTIFRLIGSNIATRLSK